MPISVNMFGDRFAADCHIRTKNGHPPQRTTGVANANSRKDKAPPGNQAWNLSATAMRDIASTTSGNVNAALTQNRRVMYSSSGLLSSATMVLDSSAIPQIGHEPGWERTISGCIGQVYCT